MEKRCVQLEEVDKDSSGLWGGESQTPPRKPVWKERPLHHQTPLTCYRDPSIKQQYNSSCGSCRDPPSVSGTNRDPASSGEAVTKQLKRALTLCTEDNTPVLKRSKRMKGRHSTTPVVKRRRMNKKINSTQTFVSSASRQAQGQNNSFTEVYNVVHYQLSL